MYAVFDADGYECKDLVGVFETEPDATAAAYRIRTLYEAYYAGYMVDMEWAGAVTVEALTLGRYSLPATAHRQEENSLAQGARPRDAGGNT